MLPYFNTSLAKLSHSTWPTQLHRARRLNRVARKLLPCCICTYTRFKNKEAGGLSGNKRSGWLLVVQLSTLPYQTLPWQTMCHVCAVERHVITALSPVRVMLAPRGTTGSVQPITVHTCTINTPSLTSTRCSKNLWLDWLTICRCMSHNWRRSLRSWTEAGWNHIGISIELECSVLDGSSDCFWKYS